MAEPDRIEGAFRLWWDNDREDGRYRERAAFEAGYKAAERSRSNLNQPQVPGATVACRTCGATGCDMANGQCFKCCVGKWPANQANVG